MFNDFKSGQEMQPRLLAVLLTIYKISNLIFA